MGETCEGEDGWGDDAETGERDISIAGDSAGGLDGIGELSRSQISNTVGAMSVSESCIKD